MWQDPRHNNINSINMRCPKCNGPCENISNKTFSIPIEKCEKCNNPKRLFNCKQPTCEFFLKICPRCLKNSAFKEPTKKNKKLSTDFNESNNNESCFSFPLILIPIAFLIASLCFYNFMKISEDDPKIIIEKLKEDYPSQKNETWYHFLSVLEREIPTVKSIIFLHGKDKRTSDCLAHKLVHLYNKNKNISFKIKDITFSDFKADDYGFILQHYHIVVQKYRVFITDLNKISGDIARIFHTLCDEESSDIKPSLFIFTLKYDERTTALKPIQKATFALRNSWHDLSENELNPLLSRVVKNVVDVVPEQQINC